MESLVGNGQPGRVEKLENETKKLQATQNRHAGKWTMTGFIVTIVAAVFSIFAVFLAQHILAK